MRKTYSENSRTATAAEDADYGELPRRSRAKSTARVSRFDDFDEEFLAPREQPELDRAAAGPRRNRASRKDEEQTRWQWLRSSTAGRCVLAVATLAILAALGVTAWATREFLRTDRLFLVASSDQVQVDGNQQVSPADVRAVFGEDMGRNLFFIPINTRQKQVESLPWVERASVERLLPNQIRVHVTERVPVAFAQDGDNVMLVDRHGVLLTPPSGDAKYSFPVLDGLGGDLPQSTRQARMTEYLAFLKDVDSHGEKVSSQLSEVDVSDPEDIQAVVANGPGTLTLHLGDQDFYQRYRMYQVHLPEWQQQVPNLGKIDLRNAPQVVLGKAEAAPEDAALPPPTAIHPVNFAQSKTAPDAGAAKSEVASEKVGQGLPEAGHGFNRAIQPADKNGALAPEVATRVPAKTSAAKPLTVASNTAPLPSEGHGFSRAVTVATRKGALAPEAKSSSAKLRRVSSISVAKSKSARKSTATFNARKSHAPEHANLVALNHAAATKPAASPTMQAFLSETPHRPAPAPRMVTHLQMPASASRTPVAPQHPSAAPAATPAPKLVMHPGFNSNGGQP